MLRLKIFYIWHFIVLAVFGRSCSLKLKYNFYYFNFFSNYITFLFMSSISKDTGQMSSNDIVGRDILKKMTWDILKKMS